MAHPPGRLIAVASGKGGVGKTTLALGVAWSLSQLTHGARITVLDADPQAGATSALGLTPPRSPLHTPAVMHDGMAIYRASRALALARTGDVTTWIERARSSADATVIDLSPALTDAMHAATLRARPFFLVAARCDAAGFPNLRETVALLRHHHCPLLVVPTFASRTRLARDAEDCLRAEFGRVVASSAIPNEARAAEAPISYRPVTASAPRSRAALAIHAVVSELLTRELQFGTSTAGGA